MGPALCPPHGTRGHVAVGLGVPGPLSSSVFSAGRSLLPGEVGRCPVRAARASCLSIPACKTAADAAVGRSVHTVRSACPLGSRCWQQRLPSVVPLGRDGSGEALTLWGRAGPGGPDKAGPETEGRGHCWWPWVPCSPPGTCPLSGSVGPGQDAGQGGACGPGDGTVLAGGQAGVQPPP